MFRKEILSIWRILTSPYGEEFQIKTLGSSLFLKLYLYISNC